MAISIHVPSWGTTQRLLLQALVFLFQSTFPRGERPWCYLFSLPMYIFQSTFPRGERRFLIPSSHVSVIFQSTFPRGERPRSLYPTICFRLFQSTFPRGERPLPLPQYIAVWCISIHVPSWGTTGGGTMRFFSYGHFNPRSLVGNDVFCLLYTSDAADE